MKTKVTDTGIKHFGGKFYQTKIATTKTPSGTLTGRYTEIRPTSGSGSSRWPGPVAARTENRRWSTGK